MKIETEALEDRQTRVTAEFDSDTLEQYKRRAARKIAQQAKIPGFRPGKAPYEIVRKMYGDEALQQEAVEIMLEDVYPQVIKEANVDPSGPGQLEKIDSVNPPRFTFVIPLKPEVEIGDYKALRKEYTPQVVTDEDIEKTVKRLQRSYATAEPVERPAQVGDMVSFKLSATRVNPAEGETPELVQESSYQMIAGETDVDEGENAWPYSGFTNELVGLSANESKTWTHSFGEDTNFEDLKGKEAEFKVTVENVKEMHTPELNDEFAHTVGDFETLEDLRKGIRTQLEQNNQQQYDNTYFNDLIGQLVDQSTVKYPPAMLEEEMEGFIHNVEHDLEHEKLDLDTYLKIRGLDREKFLEDEVKPAARRQLERSLVLNEFAERENLRVTDEEVQAIYGAAMRQVTTSDELKRYKAKNKTTNQDMAYSLATSTINNVFNQRILERLKAIGTGEGDKPVDETTFAGGTPSIPELLSMTGEEEPAGEDQPTAEDQSATETQPTGEETAENSAPAADSEEATGE